MSVICSSFIQTLEFRLEEREQQKMNLIITLWITSQKTQLIRFVPIVNVCQSKKIRCVQYSVFGRQCVCIQMFLIRVFFLSRLLVFLFPVGGKEILNTEKLDEILLRNTS